MICGALKKMESRRTREEDKRVGRHVGVVNNSVIWHSGTSDVICTLATQMGMPECHLPHRENMVSSDRNTSEREFSSSCERFTPRLANFWKKILGIPSCTRPSPVFASFPQPPSSQIGGGAKELSAAIDWGLKRHLLELCLKTEKTLS